MTYDITDMVTDRHNNISTYCVTWGDCLCFSDNTCSTDCNLNFTAYWLRDAPTGLTFNNRTLSPHCLRVLYLSEKNRRLVPLTA